MTEITTQDQQREESRGLAERKMREMEDREKATAVAEEISSIARIYLMKKMVSRESYFAVLDGTMDLHDALQAGYVDAEPIIGASALAETRVVKRASRTKKSKGSGVCLCGCQGKTGGKFCPGHDSRRYGVAKRYITGELSKAEIHPPLFEHLIEKGLVEG